MQLTGQQQDVVNIRDNTVVSAGAGAGKTAVLVERYLSLIEDDNLGVENILCLTFTRKAAGEMYRRIYQRLRRAESPALHREFLRFDRARITTIDSFCNRIIRPHAAEYGYPDFSIIDEGAFHQQLEAFTLKYLAAPERNWLVTQLLEQFSYGSITEDLFMRLARDFASPIHSPENYGEEAIALLINKELSTFIKQIPLIREINENQRDDKKNKEHHNKAMKDLEDTFRELEAIALPLALPGKPGSLIDLCRDSLSALSVLASIRTVHNPWRGFKDLCKRLEQVLLPALVIFSDHEFYRRFYAVVEDYLREVLEFRRKRGVLSYRDLLDMAIRVLRDHPGSADYYRNEIQKIMIDEFQDNNSHQKDLLFLLAVPAGYRKKDIPCLDDIRSQVLLFVGDQKQSIYRFRGADVSVFKDLSRDFELKGKVLYLNSNYRSSPRLIDFFNDLFPRIMGGELDFEAEYHPLKAALKQEIPSHIELVLMKNSEDLPDDAGEELPLSGNEAEAYAIARRIHEICQEGRLKKDVGDQALPIEYDDIAVLFRSRTMQYLIEKMLRRFAIPFTSDSVCSLFFDAPAFDIHAFLKLCLFPEDRYSLIALLRSPFCRMGDDSVVLCALSDDEGFSTEDALVQGAAEDFLPQEDQEKYNALLGLLDEIRPMIGHHSHVQVLGEIWKRSGYLDFVASDSQRRVYLEHYDHLLEFFDLHADRPMIDLLEALEENLDTVVKTDDISSVRDGGVRLMTVHKAKGLEFPVVFLVHCNGGGRSDREGSLPWVSPGEGKLLLYGGLSDETAQKYFPDNPRLVKNFRNPLVREEEELRMQQENAENRRLLYVALTRAQQHLFITASGIRKVQEETSSSPDSRKDRREKFFDLLAAGLGLNLSKLKEEEPGYYSDWNSQAGEICINIPEPVSESRMQSMALSEEPGELSGPPQRLYLPPYHPLYFTATDLQASLYEPDGDGSGQARGKTTASVSDAAKPNAADFGTMVHYMLERTQRHFFLNRELYIPPVPEGMLAGSDNGQERYEDACRLIQAFAKTSFFEELGNADELHCEFPFTMYLSPCYINGVIDLVMRKGNRTLLVDYKTGIDVNPEHYALQLDIYRLVLGMMSWPQIEAGIYDLRKNRFFPLPQQFGKQDITELAEKVSRRRGQPDESTR